MRGRLAHRTVTTVLGALAVVAATAAPLAGSASSAAATNPVGAGWNLVFADEFSAPSLDSSTWHTCFFWAPSTCTIETNNELELYTPNNVSVANGHLRLQARKQDAVGWNGKTFRYTSGMVSTGGSEWSNPAKPAGFTFTYGYAEARVRVPAGQGLWPAFWLLPNDHSWPPEIDVMEIVGDRPHETNMHYHYVKPDGSHGDVGHAWAGPDFSAGWHTFGVDWQPGSLVWYVDGVERARFTGPEVTAKESYLLLNLAVGGNWPGSPDASTAFPADYLVDYVRVYQPGGGTTAPPATAPATPPATDSAPPAVEVGLIGSSLGAVGVSSSATDNVGVTRMQLLIDGVVQASSTTDSLSYTWNARKAKRGKHTLLVKAWDGAGNVGQQTTTYLR